MFDTSIEIDFIENRKDQRDNFDPIYLYFNRINHTAPFIL